ncbi:MAG: hypothetical protein AAF799_18875 [Myxococcota bacterium]
MTLHWAIAGILAQPAVSTAVAHYDAAPSQGTQTGRLVFPPDHRGTVTVRDASGNAVAQVSLGRRVMVELPAGSYALHDADDRKVGELEVEAGQVQGVELPEAWAVPEAEHAAPTPVETPKNQPAVTTGRLGPVTPEAEREVELVRRRRWKRWASPLLSAVAPGGGQALNGQPGRGLAVFTGTLGMVLGTVALWAARDPAEGATPGDPGRGAPEEVTRLAGFTGLVSAAGLLYIGQILDAHAQAVDRRGPKPWRRHQMAFEVSRFTTVAFAPGQPAYDLYSDWSLALMGQLVPRVTFGLSDASIKYSRNRQSLTVQAGVRTAYRFFDRRRVWLAVGGGALFQGTRADDLPVPLAEGPDSFATESERAYTIVPYVHFDARLFLLDRWSLGLMPRVSLPLLPRRFARGRVLPRYAATFELGANVGVYF